MSWLNEPIAIIEDYRTFNEKQTYFLEGNGPVRSRTVTQTITRYVGCNYVGAKAKADALNGNKSISDIQVAQAGGGQYHCLATEKNEGEWSAWRDK